MHYVHLEVITLSLDRMLGLGVEMELDSIELTVGAEGRRPVL